MARAYTQCLLFVLHERKLDVGKSAALLDRSKVDGFALLPRATEDKLSKFRELLEHSGFPVLSDDQDHSFLKFTGSNSNVEVIEILLDGEVKSKDPSDGTSQESWSGSCFVDADIDIVVSLLGIEVSHKQKGDPGNIQCAVDDRNTKVFERLVRCGANISLRHPKGGTILHLAAKRGYDKLARMILNHGADVDVLRTDGSTALHVAALRGFTTIVDCLLQHRASPNVATSTGLFIGSTPLHFAVRRGHSETTELLLAHGAHVDAEDFENRTSLTLAVEWEYLEAVEIILNHRLDVIQKTSMNALCSSVYGRTIEFSGMVKMRLERALIVSCKDAYNRNLLHDAISRNSRAIVEQLSKFGDSANSLSGDNPLSLEGVSLCTAVGLKKEDIMKAFLEYGTDASARFDGANAKNSRLRNIELLIKRGAHHNALNEFGRSLFYVACKEGSSDIVQTLLDNGLDPYYSSPCEDEISLFVAAGHGHSEVVRTLLEFGVPIELRNSSGQTALHVGASLNQSRVVDLLLDYGADIHSKCNAGKTALVMAVEAGFTQVMQVLLRFDACLDFKDSEGQGILHVALRNKRVAAVETILDFNFAALKNKSKEALSVVNLIYYAAILARRLRLQDASACIDCITRCQGSMRMQTIRLKMVEYHLQGGESSTITDRIERSCLEEILKLKGEIAGSAGVSYFDLLMQDVDVIVRHVREEESVDQLLKSDELRKFPIYGGIILSQLQKANKRKELIERGTKWSRFLFSHLARSQFSSLPFGVPEKIVVHLSNKDIGRLINAFSCKDCLRVRSEH